MSEDSRNNTDIPGNDFRRSIRCLAHPHVLLDHSHNGIRVFKVTRSNHCHVFRPVPPLVEVKHFAGWDPLNDILFAYGQPLCILSTIDNQPLCTMLQKASNYAKVLWTVATLDNQPLCTKLHSVYIYRKTFCTPSAIDSPCLCAELQRVLSFWKVLCTCLAIENQPLCTKLRSVGCWKALCPCVQCSGWSLVTSSRSAYHQQLESAAV